MMRAEGGGGGGTISQPLGGKLKRPAQFEAPKWRTQLHGKPPHKSAVSSTDTQGPVPAAGFLPPPPEYSWMLAGPLAAWIGRNLQQPLLSTGSDSSNSLCLVVVCLNPLLWIPWTWTSFWTRTSDCSAWASASMKS